MKRINLDGKKILVTGAAGFIGFHLSKKLLETVSSISVIGVDNINNYAIIFIYYFCA